MKIKTEEINGEKMHFIVCALIRDNNKYLMMFRKNFPQGWASCAGHVEKGEDVITALKREVKEETNLNVSKYRLLLEETLSLNPCRYDGTWPHRTYVYEIEHSGNLIINKEEFENAEWLEEDKLLSLNLEPLWHKIFSKIIL